MRRTRSWRVRTPGGESYATRTHNRYDASRRSPVAVGDAHADSPTCCRSSARWMSVGYWSLEVWGGATFDAALRFLDENPWERLRVIKQYCPKTPLQMLLRGQNLVGYHHYSDDIVRRFVHASKRNGIDVFRVFDALNDIRNVEVVGRGDQGVRRALRGRDQLHREPGAHARQLPRVRPGAQGTRRRHHLHQGHGRACSRRSAPRRWSARSRSRSDCRSTFTATTSAAWRR